MKRPGMRMRLSLLVLLLGGCTISPVGAQRFYPVLPPDPSTRLQIGTNWSRWGLQSYETSGITVHREAAASYLVTVDYFATRYLSIGGWQNQISGADFQTEKKTLPHKVANFGASYWDVHATYYLPGAWERRWSFQIGFSGLSSHAQLVPYLGGDKFASTAHSPNLWVIRTQQVGGRSVKRHRHLIFIFGSLGYHTSEEFGHATNWMFGSSVDLSRHLVLSGSVWLNDFDQLAVRTTIGVIGTF